MLFFPHPLQDGPIDRSRWFPNSSKNRLHPFISIEDDDPDEIHCEYIGTGKWLANTSTRSTSLSTRKGQ